MKPSLAPDWLRNIIAANTTNSTIGERIVERPRGVLRPSFSWASATAEVRAETPGSRDCHRVRDSDDPEIAGDDRTRLNTTNATPWRTMAVPASVARFR
jgi:hypothetical protein